MASLDISVYGELADGFADRVAGEIAAAAPVAGDVIHLYINSSGGYVQEALAVHALLKRQAARVVATVDGAALSAASFLASAADEIELSESAVFMLHGPHLDAGPEAGASELRSTLSAVEATEKAMIQGYSRNGKIAPALVKQMLDAESWLDAETAVSMGFADRVVRRDLAKLAASVDLNQYRRVPSWVRARFARMQGAKTTPQKGQDMTREQIEKAIEAAELSESQIAAFWDVIDSGDDGDPAKQVQDRARAAGRGATVRVRSSPSGATIAGDGTDFETMVAEAVAAEPATPRHVVYARVARAHPQARDSYAEQYNRRLGRPFVRSEV